MHPPEIPQRNARGAAGGLSSRCKAVLHLWPLWPAHLSVIGLLASGAHAEIGRDYSVLVIAHVPSLCAMRAVRAIGLSGATDGGAAIVMAPDEFRIICNVPFAVRVGGLQHRKGGGRVSPLSQARPAPIEVSLTSGARRGAERIACASAPMALASSCILLGSSAADGRPSRRPGSWLKIARLRREIEPLAGASGEGPADSIASPISVALTARY